MNDASPPVLRRGLPAGLLGMIVLVAAGERFVDRHDLEFGNIAAVNWRNANIMARKARNCEILCLGSSLTTNGVQPEVIEARLGKRAKNLAVFGGPITPSYFLLKRALDSGANPKVVVLDFQDWPVDPEEQKGFPELWSHLRMWPELLSLRECLDLSWTARDASFFAAMVVSKALPSARARFEIRKNLVAALQGRSASLAFPLAGLLRNWGTHRGAQVLPARDQDNEESDVLPVYPGRRERWAFNRLTETYTRRLLELTSRRGIAVFWVFPPLGPRLTAWREKTGITPVTFRYAEDVQSRTPGVTLVDGRRTNYPARIFSDGLHLGRQGAVAYSRDLASILAVHFQDPSALPRTVALPSYREPNLAAGIPLETIYESGAAVQLSLMKRGEMLR